MKSLHAISSMLVTCMSGLCYSSRIAHFSIIRGPYSVRYSRALVHPLYLHFSFVLHAGGNLTPCVLGGGDGTRWQRRYFVLIASFL